LVRYSHWFVNDVSDSILKKIDSVEILIIIKMTEIIVQRADDKKKNENDNTATVAATVAATIAATGVVKEWKNMLDEFGEDIKDEIRSDGSDTRMEQSMQKDTIENINRTALTKGDFAIAIALVIVIVSLVCLGCYVANAKLTIDGLNSINNNITVVMHEKMMKDIDKLIDAKINTIKGNDYGRFESCAEVILIAAIIALLTMIYKLISKLS